MEKCFCLSLSPSFPLSPSPSSLSFCSVLVLDLLFSNAALILYKYPTDNTRSLFQGTLVAIKKIAGQITVNKPLLMQLKKVNLGVSFLFLWRLNRGTALLSANYSNICRPSKHIIDYLSRLFI